MKIPNSTYNRVALTLIAISLVIISISFGYKQYQEYKTAEFHKTEEQEAISLSKTKNFTNKGTNGIIGAKSATLKTKYDSGQIMYQMEIAAKPELITNYNLTIELLDEDDFKLAEIPLKTINATQLGTEIEPQPTFSYNAKKDMSIESYKKIKNWSIRWNPK